MRKGQLGLVGALVLGVTAAGCSYDDGGDQSPAGLTTTGPNGSGAAAPSSGAPSSGGTTPAGQTPAGQTPAGQTPAGQTPAGQTPGEATGPGAVPGEALNCSNVTGCGGEVAGTWNVESSCLSLAGDMDVFLTSLGCATVPVMGSLQTTGSIVFNPDGTYVDNTTTSGTVSFPLDPACLAISGVAVECDRVGSIFASIGWNSAVCSGEGGQCSCELTTEQEAGLGQILPYTEPDGDYTTMGDTLSLEDIATYSYCAETDTLTLTPQMSALTGTVVLQRDGAAPSPEVPDQGAGGMPVVGPDVTPEPAAGGMPPDEGGAGGDTGAGGEPPEQGAGGAPAPSDIVGPCDIYAAAGTPCAAAHSTVRALFGSYDGPLYQVKRGDGTTQDIPVLSPGGFADSSVQDEFCAGSSCDMWILYDQTGNGNFLEAQTPDSSVGGNNGMRPADAEAEQVSVGGHMVYSLFTRPSQAYWHDGSASGMPLENSEQGIYMVTSGTHFNEGCCYNYGNGQLDRKYNGGPQMDAVYFGNNKIWGTGAGNGPWVMADMEDGMLAWGNGGQNPNSESLPFPFVTAMEKNNGTSTFALKGADATQATLTTMWDGALPGSKTPMRRQGAVILGAGGDCCYSNNNASEGTFYEGAIVSGYPSDETDEAIHQNVVEVGYGK